MNILAIGNSFSQDATHYLAGLAAADGTVMRVYNLYIGGCSLERHWQNIEGDRRDYQYQLNGRKTDRYVSIGEVLAEEYPALNKAIHLALPDEKFRRVGQSAAAASLPEA